MNDENVQEMEEIQLKHNDKVLILGFAPSSLRKAPIDDPSFDIWPLNELYMELPEVEARAALWFQLHGYEPPTIRDPDHVKRLATMACPVVMWREHPLIPNSIKYPLREILQRFDIHGEGMAPDRPDIRSRQYFTNSISWMIALAIFMEYKEIHVYGVDMAQDQEYKHQRPSCEFFLGWARGAGIKLYLPMESDLLKYSILYGYDDASPFRAKMESRNKELTQRLEEARSQRIQTQQQVGNLLALENQYYGALEDNKYMLNLSPAIGGLLDDDIV